MRFDHLNQINYPSNNSFFPPSGQSLSFTKDASGNTVVVPDAYSQTPEAYNRDLAELRNRLQTHNWYYHLQNNNQVHTAGYQNEQAMLDIVRRRGGIFKTLWDTERSRHLSMPL